MFSSAAVPQYLNFLLKSPGVFKLHMFFMKLMDCPEGSSLLDNTDLMGRRHLHSAGFQIFRLIQHFSLIN